MNRKRILLISAGAVVALVVLLTTILVFAFPAERVGALAADKASTALGREIGVGKVRLRLFPVLAVSLEKVTVGASSPDADAPLASIARIDLRPRLRPLLSRELRIRSIIIDQPEIVIAVDSTAMPEEIEEPAPSGEAAFWDDATFEIELIRINNGSIEYRDAATAGMIALKELNEEIRLDGQLREGQLATLRLTGGLKIGSLTVDLPDRLGVPIRDAKVEIEHDALLDLAGESAQINRFALTLQELTLEGSGEVTAWSDSTARSVALKLSTGETALTPLLASLPPSWRSWPAGAAATREWTAGAGSARLDVTVDGRLGAGEVPSVNGSLDLNGVALTRGGDPVVTDLGGRLVFSDEAASTEGISGRLMGAPLELRFNLQDLAAPVGQASVATQLDLSRAAALELFPKGWTAGGIVALDLAVAGPVKAPAELAVDGSVTLTRIGVRAPEWPARLDISGGTLRFAGTDVVGSALAGSFGESDLRADFSASQWLPFAMGTPGVVPDITFAAESRVVNLDQISPYDPAQPTYPEVAFAHLAGGTVRGLSPSAMADSLGLSRPEIPAINARGRYSAGRFTMTGDTYENLEVQLALKDGRLEIPSGGMNLLGGKVGFAARLDPPAAPGASAPLQIQYTLDGIGAQQFFTRFTAFRDNISGGLRSSGSFTLALDDQLLPVITSVGGTGNLTVLSGRIINWSAVKAVGSQLGITLLDTLSFRDWDGHFAVTGPKIFLTETVMNAGELTVRAGGSFDIAGSLDLSGTVYLSPTIAAAARGRLGTLATAAGGKDGRIPVGFRISGSSKNASASLDLSEAGARLADRAKEEAEAQLRSRATNVAEKIFGTDLPAVASPTETIDSVRQRIESTVTDRLRGLLNPRQPTAPGTNTTPSGGSPDGTSGNSAGGSSDDDPDGPSGR
ncbi:MAG: AsmA family protein [Gemmatimonadota bacterium]|jgi:hypothetical protein|nr:AsmA family protein [Gemmatimonadota bacterium]